MTLGEARKLENKLKRQGRGSGLYTITGLSKAYFLKRRHGQPLRILDSAHIHPARGHRRGICGVPGGHAHLLVFKSIVNGTRRTDASVNVQASSGKAAACNAPGSSHFRLV